MDDSERVVEMTKLYVFTREAIITDCSNIIREASQSEIDTAAGVAELREQLAEITRMAAKYRSYIDALEEVKNELRQQLATVTEQRDALLAAVDNILIPPEHDSCGYLGQAADVVQEYANGEELLWKALYLNEDNLTKIVASIKVAIALAPRSR